MVVAPAAAVEQEKKVAVAPAPPSMRLLPETLADGSKVVYRRLQSRDLVPVFRGTLTEWMAWTPPELLRDESRMAEMLALGKLTGTARRGGEAEGALVARGGAEPGMDGGKGGHECYS